MRGFWIFILLMLFAVGTVYAQDGKLPTLYTCGMHPEVIENEPGMCPKCDMKLTPMDPDRTRMVLEARGEAVPEGGSGERKILYYRAPMDPSYIRKEPGKSPMGMDLVPVYEDEVKGGPTIRIDPVTEQNMGVRYAEVETGPFKKTIRTVGIVKEAEDNVATVTTKIDGWVEKVYVGVTGVRVEAGEPLFELYSPELYSAQEEYLSALRDVENAMEEQLDHAARLARQRLNSARSRLQFFDISNDQITRLRENRTVQKTLTINSPVDGTVTEKYLTQGEKINAGRNVYRVADLSKVWVIGKVYESDLPFVEEGQHAAMTLNYLPGKEYEGTVTYVYPYLEKGTREIPVRIEFDNEDGALKPGMHATVRLQFELGESVQVPSMAVIRTGVRNVAFVSREPGKFEAREIEIGLRGQDDKLQILKGLAPGERVVVSGQFLLDSESRLREATLKMLQSGMQPNTTHSANEPKMIEPDDDSEHEVLYTCPMPSHAHIVHDAPGRCEECNMKLVPVSETDHEAEARAAWQDKLNNKKQPTENGLR